MGGTRRTGTWWAWGYGWYRGHRDRGCPPPCSPAGRETGHGDRGGTGYLRDTGDLGGTGDMGARGHGLSAPMQHGEGRPRCPARGCPRAAQRSRRVLASPSAHKRFSELLPREQRDNACSARVPGSRVLTLPELRVRRLAGHGAPAAPQGRAGPFARRRAVLCPRSPRQQPPREASRQLPRPCRAAEGPAVCREGAGPVLPTLP